MADIADRKAPIWAWVAAIAISISIAIAIAILLAPSKKLASFKKPPSPAEARVAQTAEARAEEKVETRPVIIWSKWKEIPLSGEWSEYIDTPTQKDRIAPPPKGRVEVLFENGAYFELKNTSSDDKYEVIDIQMDGRFKLKGASGTKATIWIGK